MLDMAELVQRDHGDLLAVFPYMGVAGVVFRHVDMDRPGRRAERQSVQRDIAALDIAREAVSVRRQWLKSRHALEIERHDAGPEADVCPNVHGMVPSAHVLHRGQIFPILVGCATVDEARA